MTLARPLADLAEDAGFNAADLSVLSGLRASTISRLWTDPDWLDRISGRSLQALVPVLPGVLAYIEWISTGRRLRALHAHLAGDGLHVDLGVIDRLVASGEAHAEYVSCALQAATHIMGRDAQRAAQVLTRFWGRDQDLVLAHLFNPASGGLVENPTPLVDAAAQVACALRERTNSFNAFMGYATIVHHTARSTGQSIADQSISGDRQAAFLNRSTTIGLILATNDLDLVDQYAIDIDRSSVASRVEDWSLPTYTRDARASSDFWLPRSVTLHRTATEVLRELASYPEANTYYLARVYLPRALQQDPTFGGRLDELLDALARIQSGDNRTTRSIDALLASIPDTKGLDDRRPRLQSER